MEMPNGKYTNMVCYSCVSELDIFAYLFIGKYFWKQSKVSPKKTIEGCSWWNNRAVLLMLPYTYFGQSLLGDGLFLFIYSRNWYNF